MMKRVILIFSLLFGLNLSLISPTHAVNPIIALEGVGLGLNILKDVGEKVKEGFNKKKKKKTTKEYQFVCINDDNSKSKNLIIAKFYLKNHNYDLCINKSINRQLYNDLLVHLGDSKIPRVLANKILNKHDHYYKFKKTETKVVKKDKSKSNQNLKETDMLVEWVDMSDQANNINLKNFKSMSIKFHASGINYWQRYNNLNINSNVNHSRELCELRAKQRNISKSFCDLETISIKYLNGEKEYYNINNQNDLNLIVKKIKNNNQTLLSSSGSSFNWYALVKHPKTNDEFIATRVSNEKDAKKIALSKCYNFVSKTLNKKGYNDCYVDIIVDENKNKKLAQELIYKQNNKTTFTKADTNISSESLGQIINFDSNIFETFSFKGEKYEVTATNDLKARDGSKRKILSIANIKNSKVKNQYFINYYENGGKEYIEWQNPKIATDYWVYEDATSSSSDEVWYDERFVLIQGKKRIGRYKNKSDGKYLYGIYDENNKTSNPKGSWEVWGNSVNNLYSEINLSNNIKRQKFNLAKFHYERSLETTEKLKDIENYFKREILSEKSKLTKFANKDYIKQDSTITKKIAKKEPEIDNSELNKIIDKIERLMPGDYYLFAHSTTGEKFWGSTKAKNKTTQIGKATSSSGYTCDLISKQKTKYAPFKGSFELKCPNEKISGSWTQDSGYSPGIGQAFTKRGEVITAFFSYKQSIISEFASKYYDTQETKIAKKTKPKLEEFKPDDSLQANNKAPKLIVNENYTFKNSSYEIIGNYEDEHNSIFIEVDGRILQAKDGKFKIQRFSPVDEQIKLVAIDKWGKRSDPQIINVKIEIEETIIADNLEPLNPNNIRSKTNNNKVALIIGIENYSETPQASYANLDAQFFYEYSKKAFGVKPNNINLLIDEEATFVKTSKALTKWLNSKIKKNRSDLIIFFAGHGLASTDGKELYLLPQDSDPDLLSRTALSRTELFKEIMDLNPKSVTMFLDTCFSGISRDEKTLLASARPIRIVADENEDVPGNFTIFSASQLDQISSGLKEAEHGIFSYYLMKGLEGNADQNNDRKITNGELLAYMDENISQKASELGREQNPSLTGDPNQILSRY